MLKKLATAATIAVLALLTRAPLAHAQKALVYCPVGVDATGCDRIVTALTPKFTEGVDRGYDGSAGTVDLSKVDLQHYAVLIVPSLADDSDKQPYALLRKVASRLHYAINGRAAVYSGAPDQGNSNRGDKDALIQNLASWAADGHTRKASLVGMVAFLDLSEDESARYSWVRDVSLVDVSADTEDQSIGETTPVGTRGADLLKVSGRALSFTNMASNGLHIGNRGAARTEIGAIGGTTSRMSILVTYSNADGPADGLKTGKVSTSGGASFNVTAGSASLDVTGASSSTTSGAMLTTDKPDYQPGDTVTFTGAGFAPGDTVTITVHEDPTWSYPDRQFKSVADANGGLVNRQMVIDQQDFGAIFTATAVGNPSGTVAQTSFTDGNKITFSTTAGGAEATAFGTLNQSQCQSAFVQERQGNNIDPAGAPTGGRVVTLSSTPAGAQFFATSNCTGPSTTTVTIAAGQQSVPFSFKISSAGSYTISGTNPNLSTNNNASATVTVAGATRTLTITGSGAGVGSVTSLPAGINCTITAGVTSGTCSFGFNDGTPVTLTATESNTLPTVAGSTFSAWSGDGTGTTTRSLTMDANKAVSAQFKANQTITFTAPVGKTYGDADFSLGATASSGLTVTYASTTTSICTIVSGNLHIVAAGSCSMTASQAGNAADYNAATDVSRTFSIAQKSVTAATFTVSNKVYDGTTTATLTGATLSGVVAGDEANVGINIPLATATFANKNVGTGKTVNVSGLALTGSAAGNYTLSSTTGTTTANITARALTVTATGVDKAYDGTMTATVTLADNRVSGDVFTDSYTTATFADKNVGTSKPVSVSGISISGADAGNYTSNTAASTTANITAKALTVMATGTNKVYDGNTTATVTLADNRIVGDVLTDSYTSAIFANKNVGTGKVVNVTGISIAGTDAGNYTANTSTSTTADITPRALTVTATGVDKVYDGTTAASVTFSDNRVSGDVFTESFTNAVFADKNVGNGKAINVSGISLSGTDAGNYTFNTTGSTTANITPRTLVVTAHGVNKAYDGNNSATVTLTDDRVGGDVFTDAYTGATFNNKNVGTAKPVSVTGISISGTDAGNYSPNTSASTTADITPKALTIATTGVNKVYDGTTAATVTLSDNRISGDVFTDSYTSAAFNNKNVGTGKPVSVSGISISGTDAGNYTFNTTANTTADITARALTITATGVNKVYDGTNAATVTLSDNRVSGDVFTDSYTTATFSDKNVANGKTVSVSGISILGTDAGNYTFNTSTTTTANITLLQLTGAITADNKIYDGTTAAVVHAVTLAGTISGDNVSLSVGVGTFDNKNVGTGKTVTASISLTGGDAGNYSLSSNSASTTANITARALTISATGVNKVYDAMTSATVTLSDNRVLNDVFTDNYTSASFNNKNVGVAKSVSVSGISISGTDAGNYTFNTTANTSADITPFALTGHITASNKVYDATDNATIATQTLTGVFTGDVVDYVGGTAHFNNKNVGTHKLVTATGLSLGNTDAGNYTVNTTATAYADITPKALTVSAHGVNKIYDGTNAATVTLTDDHLGTDAVTDSYTTATFADKNVGTGKTVSVSGISISGTDAGNYTFNTTAATTADITPRALTVSAHGVNKVYDGGTTASVTLSDDRVLGDVFTDAYTTAAFLNKNVGTGKSVNVSGINISGADAGNYTFNTTASTTADITPKALTIAATGVNKVYDGTNAATVTLSDNRISGDVFTDSYTSATFADKNVGTGKAVSVSGISISGTDAGNYTFNTTAATTADITPRALTVTAHGVNKVYDATQAATVTLSDNRVSGDLFTDAYTTATFSDKNVGAGKTVSVSGISITGIDAGNYTFNTTASTTADITPFGITGAITANNKVYDGTMAATIATRTLTGVIPGDIANYVGGTATFSNKTVGSGKPVSATGLGLSGLDAGNYTVNTTASTTADITARPLTVTATGIDKPYDNGLTATVTLSDNRVAGDAFTDSYSSAAFLTKDVGTGITVNVSGISISGLDAGNYTFNTTANTTANITKRPVTVTVDDKQVIWTGSAITPPYTISLTTGTMAPSETFSSTLGTPAYTPATVTNVGVYNPVNVTGLNNTNYMVSIVPGTVTVLDQSSPVGTLLQLNPVALNTAGTLQANINDVNTGNSNIVAWKVSVDGAYGAETSVSPLTPNANVSAPIGPYNSTDVKKICFTGKDAGGNWSAEVCGLLAIYDPTAGFVTGGGWINSPAGAYAADLTLVGKANFGFVSKYQKGANVPTGNTEFQFQAGNLNFSSTDFQWLVIQAGNTAQFKGTGTINGQGKYNFLVTAVDGDNFGNKKPDSFRMKITDFVTGAVIYDNQMGKDDSGVFATTLGGGSIVIHDK